MVGMMARMFRVMKHDPASENNPRTGTDECCLGARVPIDIKPMEDGSVQPGVKGMSVAPRLESLFFTRVPEKYGHLVEGAAGPDDHSVWEMGKGQFVDESITQDLNLKCSKPKQGH